MTEGIFSAGVKNLSFAIDPSFLWWVVVVMAMIHIIMTVVFFYHWDSYGVNKNERIAIKTIFLLVSIALGVAMIITAFVYQAQFLINP